MKTIKIIAVQVFILFLISISAAAQQERLTLERESKVWFEGTSTLHDFTCTVTQLSGVAAVEKNISLEKLTDVKVTIPVTGIKSGKEAMDENLYEALNAEEYPEITYQLSSVSPAKSEAGGTTLQANGSLTINGKKRDITMTVKGKSIGEGKLQIEGSKQILMTDFGVTPPTMFLGTVKTGNEVTVRFSIVLKQNSLEANAQ